MGRNATVDIKDRIATVTLNRPETGNAMGKDFFGELRGVFEDLSSDSQVNSIVLTGSGKNFCVGGDIVWFKEVLEGKNSLSDENVKSAALMAKAIFTCPKPVIAMVNGAAAGAGFSMALACDFRVISESSRFIMAFINMALPVDTLGLYLMEKAVGLNRTRDVVLRGEPLSAGQAFDMGLATRLVEDRQLSEAAYALAAKMAAMPLGAVRRQKALLAGFFYADLDAYIEREYKVFLECFQSPDIKEAVYAFLEKRKANFTDR